MLTVFFDLLQAVAAGMIISSIIFIKRMGDITQKDSTTTAIQSKSEQEKFHKRYQIPEKISQNVAIKRINGPLFFGNSDYFIQLGKKISANALVLIIDMKLVPYLDQSGLYALESIILSQEQKNVQVFLLHLQPQPEAMMRNINLIPNLVEANFIYDDEKKLVDAVNFYVEKKLEK